MLAAHAGVVAFVLFGLIAIIAGGFLDLRPVRNRSFRLVHLGVIVVIAGQTWLGMLCPLTTLEQALRQRAGQPGYAETFTEHWIAPLIFFDAPWWAFTAIHSVAALVVVGTWFLVPPVWFPDRSWHPRAPDVSQP